MSRSYLETVWEQVIQTTDRLTTLYEQVTSTGMRLSDEAESIEKAMEKIMERLQPNTASSAGAPLGSLDESLKKELTDLAGRTESVIREELVRELTKSHDQIQAAVEASLNAVIHEIRTADGANLSQDRNQPASRYKWLAAAVAVVLLIVSGAVLATWKWVDLQYRTTHETTAKILAADSGRAAVSLAGLNDVQAMMDCRGFRTVKKNGRVYCIPLNEKKEIVGWRIK